MAYLDDNNDNLYSRGDPLDELDKELADLKETLGKLESDPPTPKASPKIPAVPPQKAEEPQETIKPPIPEIDEKQTETKETEKTMKHSSDKNNGGKHRLPLIIVAIVLAAALVIGVGLLAMKLLSKPVNDDGEPVSSGEKVTINDSVMGNIELQTVKGAAINTYTADNLQYDENGYPSYYEDGKKISHLGVDLSEYQGDVDFAAMKNAGVEFVMLRIGGRYYGDDGLLYTDKAFDNYYQQAKAAGLKVGAYFFSQAASAEDAAEEAKYAIEKLSGKQLDYPIALDWENIADDTARTDNVTGDQLTDIAETFCDTVTASGYKSLVYSNTQQMFVMYDFETMKDYDFWLADYREFPTMYYKFDMWQYTMEGKIDGVEGTVDLNISFTDFTD